MLEVKNLVKHYGNKQALAGISFSVNRGEVVGFLGANGAGKSTTMNIITGYLSPTDGDVIVDGSDILTEPLSAKSKIGYLPEQPPVYQDMKVQEYLSFLYDLKKVKKSKKVSVSKAEHLADICARVGISEVSQRMIRNLSKGYQQRVGLAQALIGDPDILILDEPTVGLDPAQIIEIRGLIQELAKQHTILLSSHILPEVQAVCGRIVVIHHGKLVADGTTESLSQKLTAEPVLTLEAEGAPAAVSDCLSKVHGVLAVHSDPDQPNCYHLKLEQDEGTGSTNAVRRNIFHALAQKDYPILSMSRNEMSLEEIFLKLTEDSAAPPLADPEEAPHRIKPD